MKNSIPFLAACCLLTAFSKIYSGEMPERWNYVSGNTMTEEDTQKVIAILKKSKEAGCTHVLYTGCRGPRIPELTEEQRGYDKRVQDEAKKLGIKIIPSIFSIGYSGRYFHFDPNLAAGVPVKNMPYVVKGKIASPDPALALDASLLKREGSWLSAEYAVKPFMYYRVSFMISTEPQGEELEELVKVTSSGGKRWNSRTNPTVTKQKDKYFAQTVFNTLEGDKIQFSINCSKGNVSDVKIEPAGMLLVLRRSSLPLIVTSEDGKTSYVEGTDFKPIADAPLLVKPFPGEFPIDHPAPVIELTDNSSIKDGQRLQVSFWHCVRIYTDQDMMSMEDPKTWEILELEMKEMSKLWPTEGYMLAYDEIRVAGWEPKPDGKQQTPGQMLAEHFKHAYNLVHKYAPDAKIYTWSDMFTPYHNAYPFGDKGYYYLVNGNWDGSWEGVPKDVIIMNWYSPDAKSVKFFADRGHQQVLCGFYDGKTDAQMKENIGNWEKVSEGAPGILGFMYTTWQNNYKNLGDYFKLVDTYEKWKK